MVELVSVCVVICFLAIKRCQTFIVLKWATYAVFVCFEILITYIALKVSSCVNFSVIFASRASIISIDSGTCDTIRVSLALAIWFFDISINRYTPIIESSLVWFMACGLLGTKQPWHELGRITYISVAYCKTAVTPLLTQWSYCCLALSHQYTIFQFYKMH